MKRIMLLVPNLKMGGQERVAVETDRLLTEAGYECYLCIFDGRAPFYEASSRNLIDLGIPASDCILIKIVNFLRRIRAVKKLKKRLMTDCCYSFGVTADLANIFSGRCGRIITSIHGFASTQGSFNRFIVNPLIAAKSDLVITVSEQMAGEFKSNIKTGREKVRVLYNPYPIDKIRQESFQDCDMEVHDKTVMSMGRFAAVKGYGHLIRAVKYVTAHDPEVRLMILGDGPEKEKMRDQIKELDLENHVFLPGNKVNPFCYLRKGGLYCLSSFSEGFPNSLVEAMACGLPILSVDCKSGPREILGYLSDEEITKPTQTSCGVLIPAFQTPDDVEEKEERFLGEEILRMLGEKKRKEKYERHLEQRCQIFSSEKYLEQLISLIT